VTTWKDIYKNKIIQPNEITDRIREIRAPGKTLVTLNGAFDLLHAGHLHILYEASKQGDILIVALNSDKSIKQYKSTSRPFIPLEDRLQMMCALGFVDYVTWFEEPDPVELLKKIQPDVHVNGSDYKGHCIEETVVPKVHYVELVPGLSTSQIVEKIKTCD